MFQLPEIVKKISDTIEAWQPHMAICDREFFLPFACTQTHLPCISVNHSHVLLNCRYHVPADQWLSWSLAMLNDHLFFDHPHEACIVSFYHPPVQRPHLTTLFPPVLRPEVLEQQPSHGDHVLVYQTSNTFKSLLEPLKKLSRTCIIYGMSSEERIEGNLHFKPYDLRGITQDLAGCAYAVVNGGHNLICEALYYGKPVLCFPIANHFEQFLNSWHIKELGYGEYSLSRNPELGIFQSFEERLSDYASSIQGKNFNGVEPLVHHLQQRLNSI